MAGVSASIDQAAIDVLTAKNYIYSKDDAHPLLKATVRGTFAFAVLDTLKKYDQNSKSRSQSDWKRAQYVIVADVQADRGTSLLRTWRGITRAETGECSKVDGECQVLLVRVSDDNYVSYDASGEECMEGPLEDLVEDFMIDGDQIVMLAKLKEGGLQQISYGAPGTGKSKGVNDITSAMPLENVIRTTFHPDSDYSTFVGAYKPTMVAGKIAYEFVPQAFAKAYVQAWKMMAKSGEGEVQPVMLVIEEINRGDCAKVFGDLFQLLDRRVKDDEHDPSKKAGFSEYPVLADSDLADYVRRELTKDKSKITETYPSVVADDKLQLILPPNLYIWATMNTSDQSLFPMDSAFKRRWDWKYVPISKPDEEGFVARKILVGNRKYDWWDFISVINAHIAETTKSEDKQLGYFFVKAPDDTGVITEEQFVNKVLFYLYNDVFKDYDYPAKIFGRPEGEKGKYAFQDFFHRERNAERKPGDVRSEEVQAFLGKLEFGGKGVADELVENPSAPAESLQVEQRDA